MRSVVASHRSWQWPTESHHPSRSSYNYVGSFQRTQCQPFHSHSAFIWSKLERWESSISGCFVSWLQIKKWSFWSIIFSYSTQQWTISQLEWDAWWKDNQRWPAQWLNPEEVPKHFPKPNLHQKRPWLLSHGLLPVCSTTAFSAPVRPLRLLGHRDVPLSS